MSSFSRYIGIDYSGAQTPTQSLKGLRVYKADGGEIPVEVLPPPSPRLYWNRREVAEWLVATLKEPTPTLVGIDHGFSFPLPYFDKHGITHSWDAFLDDFCLHWPTDGDHVYVDFVRDGACGNGAARTGNPRWRRLTELRARAKSPFHFDVKGSVAKSTHAGIPWLRQLRKTFGPAVHFWPFDGWTPRSGVHVVAEAYPALWRSRYFVEGLTSDQHDAYTVSRWLQESDSNGELNRFFKPSLDKTERMAAEIEGWILGVA
ncbi:MAG: hypothetical protein LHV69_07610 [Elusimicrobia bacterium]|nr:hypothetical protein [Candidatus Obscuribacterium magneticum]